MLHLSTAGDAPTLELWKRFRDLSIKAYEEAYRRLNVHFDVYSGESLVTPKGIQEAVDRLRAKGLLVEKLKSESVKNKNYHQDDSETQDESLKSEDVGVGHDDDSKPAWAVDLNAWKLGKPVIQKPGSYFINFSQFLFLLFE